MSSVAPPRKKLRLIQEKSFDRHYDLFEDMCVHYCVHYAYIPPKTRLEEVTDMATVSALERGHMIVEKIRETMQIIDELYVISPTKPFERTRDQRLFHDKMIESLFPFIYASAYHINEIAIKKYNRVREIHTANALSAPRRFGKSVCLAIIMAVLFMSVPFMEICFIAQSSRTVGKDSGILGKVLDILNVCFSFKPTKSNAEELAHSFPDLRKIHAYSAGANNGYVLMIVLVCVCIQKSTFILMLLSFSSSPSRTR